MKYDKHLKIETTIHVEENEDTKLKEEHNRKFIKTKLVSVLTEELQILKIKMKSLKIGKFFGTLAAPIILFWTSVLPSVNI
jgi:hypothetical protein